MKILYISPENTVGTLCLWKRQHEAKGNTCRTVTFFSSPKNFDEDICLHLPFNFTKSWLAHARHQFYKLYRGKLGYRKEKFGFPPAWSPEGKIDKWFLLLKEQLWKPQIIKAIEQHNLYDFDVVHFESGMDFFKDSSFAAELKRRGVKIICHYHGEDLRTRGVMPELDAISDLNLTNEVDLLKKHPNIHYLFLPFNTEQFSVKTGLNKKIRVCHAPTNRYYKGSDSIISVCKKLESEGLIQFDLVENLPHKTAIERKQKADIFIDQIGDKGGWGYGMNSVESLSMGMCTLTQMNEEYQFFLPDHPFVHIEEHTLASTLRELVADRNAIQNYAQKGKQWVKKHHHIDNVVERLYEYYHSIGLDT